MDKKFWVKKIFGEKFEFKNILGTKQFWSKKWRPQKILSKSLVKIRSVTTEIFLIWTNVVRTMLTGECQGDSSNLLKMDPGTYLKSLVKIGSATTEILLTLSLWWWVVGGGWGCWWGCGGCAKSISWQTQIKLS